MAVLFIMGRISMHGTHIKVCTRVLEYWYGIPGIVHECMYGCVCMYHIHCHGLPLASALALALVLD